MPIADRAAGELVVELTQQANAFVSPFIPDTVQGGVFTTFGVPFVDAALELVSVQSITRLYADVELVDCVNLALVDSMRATYVLRFAPGTDLDFVISVLSVAPGFANVEPVGIVRAVANANDPFFAGSQPPKNQWGLFKIGAPEAWDRQTGANLIKITVIDSGCDKDHPNLIRPVGAGLRLLRGPAAPSALAAHRRLHNARYGSTGRAGARHPGRGHPGRSHEQWRGHGRGDLGREYLFPPGWWCGPSIRSPERSARSPIRGHHIFDTTGESLD